MMKDEKNLAFLLELKDRLIKGFHGDAVQEEFAMRMIQDWIDELEEKVGSK